jgi:D-alanyl-D-alanine carboxypeptidase/D-alanyl-D-alanine-endopeptidase (penicillin-binding protein 4)
MPTRRTRLTTAAAAAALLGLLTSAAPALAAAGPPVPPASPPATASLRAAAAPAPPAAVPPARKLSRAAAQSLGRSVSAALATAGARTVGGAVEIEGYGGIYRRNSKTPLPPASTQKNVTGLLVLLALGPSARLRTEVAATAVPVGGRLEGSLWLVGGGDPYLTSAGLRQLAADVRAAGVTTVAGDVLLDDTRYDGRRRAAGWKASFMPGQSGPLSALAVDRNAWRRDRAFLADPALPAAARFRDMLTAAGVTVSGTVRRQVRPAEATTLAARPSAPMSAVVARVLKTSDNFAAELLLKELGRVVRADGSSAGGTAAARTVLARIGVAPGASADGSGLSAHDRQAPGTQVALLRAARASAVGASFRAALPIGCVDGTLRRRFCRTAAAGRVSAKTGTLLGVRTLAGYTTTASGRPVFFAFQLSGVRDGARALRALDRAVVLLASSRS